MGNKNTENKGAEKEEIASKEIDRKKVIEEMKALKDIRIEAIKKDIIERGDKIPEEEELENLVTIKYLGKMEFLNEKGELIDKDVFISIEQVAGQFQIRYYDEELKLLGIQRTLEEEIIPSEAMIGKLPKELEKIEKEKIEEAKTLEELEEEQRQEELQQAAKKQQGPQLTQKQVNSLSGPTVSLRQPVDSDMSLGIKIGLEGAFIKFVDINEAKKLIPDLNVEELGQQFIPLEIYSNGTANVVSEDKIRFSTLKGSNSTERSITENNDGTRTLDQSIVTFEIPGTHNFISVGFNEQHMVDPYYEVKFQTIDRDSNKLGGEELEQKEVGTIEDPTAHNERRINTEGQLKYTKELVTEEQAERYAMSQGIYLDDSRKPDLDKARAELERLAIGGKSVNEVVEEAENEQLMPGRPRY